MIANPLVKFAWSPTAAQLEAANVVRLARALGCEDYTSLHRVSVEEPERFWRAVADDLELELTRPWDNVRNDSRGIEWTTWFEGARLNIATACLHAWARRTPDASAAVFRGEDGARREWTFAELSRETVQIAEALKSFGVEPGDRVAIYMPMSPEAAIASHACAHIGAVQVPIFSGFAAPAIVQRLQDSGAKVVITADYSLRRGTRIPMRETVEEALRDAPSVEHVLMWKRESMEWDVELGPGRAAGARGRGGASRTCSPTPRARPGGPRARCTCRAASCSRSHGRRPTSPRSAPATASSSQPTWAGSWGPGRWSAPVRSERPSCTWKARRTGPTTGSGAWSRRSA